MYIINASDESDLCQCITTMQELMKNWAPVSTWHKTHIADIVVILSASVQWPAEMAGSWQAIALYSSTNY